MKFADVDGNGEITPEDASSTAIYGSRGSNGVVLITTKSGKAGVREIMFDASVGVSNVYKRYDILEAYDYALALKEVKGIDFSNEEMQSCYARNW